MKNIVEKYKRYIKPIKPDQLLIAQSNGYSRFRLSL